MANTSTLYSRTTIKLLPNHSLTMMLRKNTSILKIGSTLSMIRLLPLIVSISILLSFNLYAKIEKNTFLLKNLIKIGISLSILKTSLTPKRNILRR
jgi:hypothetical protein